MRRPQECVWRDGREALAGTEIWESRGVSRYAPFHTTLSASWHLTENRFHTARGFSEGTMTWIIFHYVCFTIVCYKIKSKVDTKKTTPVPVTRFDMHTSTICSTFAYTQNHARLSYSSKVLMKRRLFRGYLFTIQHREFIKHFLFFEHVCLT